jgi:O-antigen/teichoic acid export membrane protein
MRKLTQRITLSSFVRNIAILSSGSAIAQGVSFLGSPILSRVYSPEEFGVLAGLLAVGTPLVAIGGLKYEAAIPLAKNDEEALSISVLGIMMVSSIALVTALTLLFIGDWIAQVLKLNATSLLLLFIPAFILVSGLNNVAGFWANRKRRYTIISISEMAGSGGKIAFQILLGLFEAGVKGLLVGRLIGLILALTAMILRIPKAEFSQCRNSCRFESIKRVASVHSQFPKYTVPREVLVSTSSSFAPIMFLYFFGPVAAGLYWFAFQLLRTPISMLAQAVRRVFYERAASLERANKDVWKLHLKTTLSLTVLAVGPTVVIVVFGPQIFGFVFGSEWIRSGIYAQWLVVFMFSSFISTPTLALAPILKLQRAFLAIDFLGLLVRVLVLTLFGIFADDLMAVAAFSLASVAMNMFKVAYVLRYRFKQK